MMTAKIFFPEDSPFLCQDMRKNRWAIPYNFECLNARIENLLWKQNNNIAGKKILDIACHMGTFSYAALQMGAVFVQGLDAEQAQLEHGKKLFEQLKIPQKSYKFEAGDIQEILKIFPENSFDTIFCFGILYYCLLYTSPSPRD